MRVVARALQLVDKRAVLRVEWMVEWMVGQKAAWLAGLTVVMMVDRMVDLMAVLMAQRLAGVKVDLMAGSKVPWKVVQKAHSKDILLADLTGTYWEI